MKTSTATQAHSQTTTTSLDTASDNRTVAQRVVGLKATALASIIGITFFSSLALTSAPVMAQEQTSVATVNGEPVSQSLLDIVTRQFQNQRQNLSEDEIVDELINLTLLTQLAEKAGLHERDEIASALDLQRMQILSNGYLREISDTLEATEYELKEQYDNQVEGLAKDEFQVSQIMTDTEEDATKAIAILDEGKAFAEVAKELSIDAGAKQGGDLGWVHTEALPAQLVEVLATMEKGSYSKTPVKTDFGWHILELRDKRGTPVPTFESVKSQLQSAFVAQRIQKKLEELRADAEIVR